MSSTASRRAKQIREFGDFQTPDKLAYRTAQIVRDLGVSPRSIVEPTCGLGSFLIAAAKTFDNAQYILGVEINAPHLAHLHERLGAEGLETSVTTLHADFFTLDWPQLLSRAPEPILVIGNPPWVTSAELSRLQSANLPAKSNFQRRSGLEALTGKSNFDLSESILLQILDWLKTRTGAIAMLCKSATARKVLTYAWKHRYPVSDARIYRIDALEQFNASVDACFLVIQMGIGSGRQDCALYADLDDVAPSHTIGYYDGFLVADVSTYRRWRHLHGADGVYTWRSGIKHDSANVMELERDEKGLRNSNGVYVSLEDTYLYPLFKSSDVGNGRTNECRKYMLVTQNRIGEDTSHIEQDAPNTWRYLQDNVETLAKRASSIYRNQPPFSIFGVGEYTFAPWKVAISAFYKRLHFEVVGPIGGRPAVFDDTIYFLACWSEEEAHFVGELLNSAPATEFLSSMIFWSDKRPITIDLLKRLKIGVLARELGREPAYLHHITAQTLRRFFEPVA
jgi:hypothetical protein